MRVLLMLLLAVTAAVASDAEKALAMLSERQPTSLETEWFVGADEAVKAVQDGQAMLVDVRRVAIGVVPGALQVGLEELVNRGGVGNGRLMLLHEGYGFGRLVTACKRLGAKKRSAALIRGGVFGWAKAGGAVSMDGAEWRTAARIEPGTLFLDTEWREVTVVELAESPGCIPGAMVMPTRSGAGGLAKVIAELAGRPATAYVAVAADEGMQQKLERLVSTTEAPVLWIVGGSSAYAAWLERQVALWKGPSTGRGRLGCPTCP